MRYVFGLGMLAAVAAVAWLLFGDPAAPAGPTPTEPGAVEGAEGTAATLTGRGRAEEPQESGRVYADPAAFLARLEGMTGKALSSELLRELGTGPPLPPDEALVARLIELIRTHDPHDAVHQAARIRLAMLEPAILPQLLELLYGETQGERLAALLVLQGWRTNKLDFTLPDLLPLLDLEDHAVRTMTLALLTHGVPFRRDLHDRLLARAKENDFLALRALIAMGDPAFDSVLAMCADAPSRRLQWILLELPRVGRDKLRRAVPALRAALARGDARVRSAALQAAIALGEEARVLLPELRQVLSDGAEDSILTALIVLQGIGPSADDTVPLILPLLEHHRDDLVISAVRALGRVAPGDEEARLALVTLVREGYSDDAGKALAAWGDDGLAEALAILDGDDPDAKYAALWTLAMLGEQAASAVPRLIPLISQTEDVMLRQRAIGAAGYIGPKAAAVVPHIMTAFTSEEMPLTAADTTGSLARLGPRAHSALRRGLRGDDVLLKLRCAEALGAFHGTSQFALDDLEPLLKAEDAELRDAAVQALRAAVAPPQRAGEENPALRDVALRARLAAAVGPMGEDPDPRVRGHVQALRSWLDEIDDYLREQDAEAGR